MNSTFLNIAKEALREADGLEFLDVSNNDWRLVVLDDLTKIVQSNILERHAVVVLKQNISRYGLPSDCHTVLVAKLLRGNKTGTLSGGSISTFIVSGLSQSDVEGYNVLITSGAGEGSMSQCYSYDENNGTGYVTPDFNTAPSNGSGYMIITTQDDLEVYAVSDYDKHINKVYKGIPKALYYAGTQSGGEFYIHPVPKSSYGLLLRYIIDATKITDDTELTLIYNKYRNLFYQYIYARALKLKGDPKYSSEMQLYYNLLQMAKGGELSANLTSIQLSPRR